MIFITLGSQKFQFNRLLEAADMLGTDEKIFAQTGYSDYKPKNYDSKEFLDMDDFLSVMEQAEVVITHGGSGAIMSAVKKGKKVIAVPRLAEYGEHVDDHQVQLIRQFKNLNFLIACEDMNLKKALYTVRNTELATYRSNTEQIIRNIEKYIDECIDE